MIHLIKNRSVTVKIDEFGAQPISVVACGKERLWQNEDGSWTEHAPVLFPVCGHVSCVVDGKEYPMPPHGFAKDFPFVTVKKSRSSVTLSLTSNNETKKVFPFDFKYSIKYTLKGKKLSILNIVENLGDEAMYFACGGHESFVLDGSLSEYKLVFPLSETFVHRPNNKQGYISSARETLGVGKELILPESYLHDSNSVILEGLRSEKVSLCANNGKKVAELSFKGLHTLLLWRPSDCNMVCIEPWSNLPDSQPSEQKEFSQKRGVFKVLPKKKKKIKRSIVYR